MDNKKKFKISIIDILVVLVIVAVVAVAAVMVKPMLFSDSTSENPSNKIVTVELAKQQEFMTTSIKEGEIANDANLKKEFGKVVSYEVKPATETVVSETDGTAKIVEVPERYDIYVKFETSGNESAEVGKLVTVYTKSFKASGYVVNIESEIKGDDLPVKDVTAKGAAQ